MKHTVRMILVLVPAMFVLGVLSSGCAPTVREPVEVKESPAVLADSSPNWDFITLKDTQGLPSRGLNPKLIGSAILGWEQSHPDRKIVSLQIVYQPSTYTRGPYVDGVSIYSELK